jgi:hypothetical protein
MVIELTQVTVYLIRTELLKYIVVSSKCSKYYYVL